MRLLTDIRLSARLSTMLSKMASKIQERNIYRGGRIDIQNHYFIIKISITHLGHGIKNSQLFVPVIVIIFYLLICSL